MAIDGRDERFRSSINYLDIELFSKIPEKEERAKAKIDVGLASIAELQMAIVLAEHTIIIFDVEQSYLKRNLQETNREINIQLSGFSATQEANIKILEQKKNGLELTSNQSSESNIVSQASATAEERRSMLTYVIGGVFAGGFLGCFLAFFLELVAKAKVRATALT